MGDAHTSRGSPRVQGGHIHCVKGAGEEVLGIFLSSIFEPEALLVGGGHAQSSRWKSTLPGRREAAGQRRLGEPVDQQPQVLNQSPWFKNYLPGSSVCTTWMLIRGSGP